MRTKRRLQEQENEELKRQLEETRTHYEDLLRDQDSILLGQDALIDLRVIEELQQKVSAHCQHLTEQLNRASNGQ